jgi:glycosyltransferase involved in cell wall biosynthesis
VTGSPTVSVIIAGYEAERFIANAVKSALAQTLSDIEVIVVDDASPDATLVAAEAAAAGDKRLQTIKLEKNGGPSAARNAGFAASRGTWIAVLDSDDAFAPERLAKLVAFAEKEGADIVTDALSVTDEAQPGATPKTFDCVGLPEPVQLAAYARDNRMFRRSGGSGYLKPMFRREFLERHGLGYDPSLRLAEDWTLAAEALAHGAKFSLLHEPLYRYTIHAGSISARLSTGKLVPLLAAADAFLVKHRARLSPDDIAALKERRSSLANALAFQTFVERAKAKDIPGALGALASRPGSWPLLRMPILARLKGSRGARETFG